MFFISNVKDWLDEVADICVEDGLRVDDSIFVLVMFSSLDFDIVEFFRRRKAQISQYSGENVHIFTPMIFEGNLIPDTEWRGLRDNFNRSGIKVDNQPTVILFRLKKRVTGTGYEPEYFAAFALPQLSEFELTLRHLVDSCIAHRSNPVRLTRHLSELFRTPNLVERAVLSVDPVSSQFSINDALRAPSAFISYSHADKQSVLDLYERLKKLNVKLWLDQYEVLPGDRIQERIEHALQSSDALLTVLSRNSSGSYWLQFEGSYFYGRGEKPIVPIVLDDEGKSLVAKLPFLNGRAYADLSNPEEAQRAVAIIAKALLRVQNAEG